MAPSRGGDHKIGAGKATTETQAEARRLSLMTGSGAKKKSQATWKPEFWWKWARWCKAFVRKLPKNKHANNGLRNGLSCSTFAVSTRTNSFLPELSCFHCFVLIVPSTSQPQFHPGPATVLRRSRQKNENCWIEVGKVSPSNPQPRPPPSGRPPGQSTGNGPGPSPASRRLAIYEQWVSRPIAHMNRRILSGSGQDQG